MKDDLNAQFGPGAEESETFALHCDAIVDEIVDERNRQRDICKHGGNTDSFDKGNSRNDWVAYISAYNGRGAAKCSRNEKEGQDFRANMVKVAALAIAAIEAHDQGWC